MLRSATIFLLSPAYCGGQRARILLNPHSSAALAVRLQAGALTLGEAFSFLSGLYFRGKLAYADAFGRTPKSFGLSRFVITPTRGLLVPETPVSVEVLREFAQVDVSANDARYRVPLERDVSALAAQLGGRSRVVLLGSVATGKYSDVLAALLGPRLHYPPSFIGRGDMSRGGLLLRAVASGAELEYEPLQAGLRPSGPRPPKLPPLRGR
jgi:hypothetical protein